MDVIGIGGSGTDEVGFGPTMAGSVDKVPILQNLTVLSLDADMREVENVREVTVSVCPTRVSTG